MVPFSFDRGTPCSRATRTYNASKTAAVELIVMEVDTLSKAMPAKSLRMSTSDATDTPTRPTSPAARG